MIDKQRRALFKGRTTVESKVDFILPWLKDKNLFLDKCTQCGECSKACPEGIIVKGEAGYPTVDFQKGECTFCKECTMNCPESLFDTEQEQPWLLDLDISKDCFAKRDIVCQSCGDVCDTQAISFVYETTAIAKPIINKDACTACGACVGACPAKAITVVENKEMIASV